jgi:Rifampin ADP-ribosyl transferase
MKLLKFPQNRESILNIQYPQILTPGGIITIDGKQNDRVWSNPTRFYRSTSPLKIVGEITEWVRLTSEELQKWREKIANIKADSTAEIIN